MPELNDSTKVFVMSKQSNQTAAMILWAMRFFTALASFTL